MATQDMDAVQVVEFEAMLSEDYVPVDHLQARMDAVRAMGGEVG